MTRKKVLEYVKRYTAEDFSLQANASVISEKLGVSRNLISQYLNELHSEGLLAKVKSRPVCYYHSGQIEESYSIALVQKEFASRQALLDYVENHELLDFDKLIGGDSSLARIVEQCKATVSYPPKGLPILLHGPSGSGKSFMAQLIHEYAVNNGIVEPDRSFITLNCSDYANNPELLTDNLFGHRKGAYTGAESDNDGLIKLADGGFLFLDEIHSLTAESQEKLFLYMDKGIYHMMGDNETWYNSSARLIFATTENPKDALLKTLLRRIPVVLKVPALQERQIPDKIRLIKHFFQQEEEKMDCLISLSAIAYQTLLSAKYPGDVGELKSTVQASCISAYFSAGLKTTGKAVDGRRQQLLIKLQNLPEKLLGENALSIKNSLLTDTKQIPVGDLAVEGNDQDSLIAFYQDILKFFVINRGRPRFQGLLDRMYNYLYTEMIQYKNEQGSFIKDVVRQILDIISDKYKLFFSNNLSLAIANYAAYSSSYQYVLENFFHENGLLAESLLEYMKEEIPLEFRIAEEIVASLEIYLDSKVDPMMKVVLACNIYRLNKNVYGKQIGVILAHGYSTASSMAEAANSILGQYIFESIDMPMQVSVDTVVTKLNQWLERLKGYEDVLILVDMGSLEAIHQGLTEQIGFNVGIINNVTTRIAIAVGEGIRRRKPVETILEEAAEECSISHTVIRGRHKEEVILCSCASGIGTAEQLKEIVISSLPSQESMKVLTCDYRQLMEKNFREQLRKSYHVLCIIGTLNPNITESDMRFLSIDELISGEAFGVLDASLGTVLTAEELERFKQNVLKNFSLLNIVNNLTILNPNKVIDQVVEAVSRLQALEGTSVGSGVTVGLYIHICCLIEKLLTRQNPGNYLDVQTFQENCGQFIQNAKEALRGLEQYYRVDIPVDEIGYIYDYMYGPSMLVKEDF